MHETEQKISARTIYCPKVASEVASGNMFCNSIYAKRVINLEKVAKSTFSFLCSLLFLGECNFNIIFSIWK